MDETAWRKDKDTATLSPDIQRTRTSSSSTGADSSPPLGAKTPTTSSANGSSPGLSAISRNPSWTGSTPNPLPDDWEAFPPLERLTVLDLLENLALSSRLEKLQNTISAQTEKVRRQQAKLANTAKERVVEEWRRRLPPPDEQLEKYKKRVRGGVDRLGRRWNDTKAVTTREKLSFIAGVMNIFISGYLIGAFPQYFYWWFTTQLAYFFPIRFYTYHQKGYHYFLADLCYFVNFLLILSIWVFPNSKRLFISTYCLAYGNNAVAIAMWRNSMVFHSLDKVTSLFIHIMPPVTLHCIVHLLDPAFMKSRFPAVYAIRFSAASSPQHYSLGSMMIWATCPYAIWQLSYHFLITVRRREKIAAGRPTSFTWLRRSYSKTWIGRLVLSLPDKLQEPAFMLVQYTYAVITMLPCPLWFWYRWLSAGFLLSVFVWSVYNGATYYIDVFGTRFQKELEALKKDMAKWQKEMDALGSPLMTPAEDAAKGHGRKESVDDIPLLEKKEASSAVAILNQEEVSRRK
ncbi:MAG: hypothetical protein M1814_006109 [Vezdaea aestivalis]|nr:MAG: hypothetical protein M1814_006109 [Vezdaea aestivalis]